MTADTTPSLVERPWECRWVEPSNAERNEWPATTLEYVSALENSYENLLEEHGAAIGRAVAAEANARRLSEALTEREQLILDAHDALDEASENLRGSDRQPAREAYDRARRTIYAIRSRPQLTTKEADRD